MGLNDDNIPESKKKELLDMAYNVLPEGADYDVFSENISKEVKPTLLYDDIYSEPPKKVSKEKPQNDSEQTDSNADSDMFAENSDLNPDPKNSVSREYLDRLYKDGIELPDDTIIMTRSDYIAEYNRTNEYYDGEEKKCKKNFLLAAGLFAFGITVLRVIELLQLNAPLEITPGVVHPIYRILNGVRTLVFVANPVISIFFLTSAIKSIKNVKKSRKKALSRLEQRKQELMILGLYDTAN